MHGEPSYDKVYSISQFVLFTVKSDDFYLCSKYDIDYVTYKKRIVYPTFAIWISIIED